MKQQSSFDEFLKRHSVSLDALLEGLDFSDSLVVQAAIQQGQLYAKASTYRIKLWRRRASTKTLLKSLEITTRQRLREEAAARKEKIPVNVLADMVHEDPEVKRLTQKLDDLESQEEWAKLLLGAYQMRKDSLRIVSDMVRLEETVGKVRVGDVSSLEDIQKVKAKLRKKYPGGS